MTMRYGRARCAVPARVSRAEQMLHDMRKLNKQSSPSPDTDLALREQKSEQRLGISVNELHSCDVFFPLE